MKYSVIIPTYNRPEALLLTLESVAKQTISPEEYEIMVCDDGSRPETARTVLGFIKSHPQNIVRYYYHPNGGPAKARNTGIKHTWGEIIFFTDDDCMVPWDWMETLLDGYKRYPRAVGVGGHYKPANAVLANSYLQKYINIWEHDPSAVDTETETNIFNISHVGNTANMSYKRAVLEEVGGFDENLYFPGAVDLELKKAVISRGHYLVYVPLFVNHLKKFDLKTFVLKYFNQGRGRYYMTLKYPDLKKNSFYDISFTNFLKHLVVHTLNGGGFFLAHFARIASMHAGRIYAAYVKPFPPVFPAPKREMPVLTLIWRKTPGDV